MVYTIKRKLEDKFFCKGLARQVQVSQCLDNYVDANSLNLKDIPCFKCPMGLKVRIDFANSP